jgi:predicted alpha/beta hydrolase family esterase
LEFVVVLQHSVADEADVKDVADSAVTVTVAGAGAVVQEWVEIVEYVTATVDCDTVVVVVAFVNDVCIVAVAAIVEVEVAVIDGVFVVVGFDFDSYGYECRWYCCSMDYYAIETDESVEEIVSEKESRYYYSTRETVGTVETEGESVVEREREGESDGLNMTEKMTEKASDYNS